MTKPSYTYKMVAYPGLESDIVTSKSKKTSTKIPRELRKVKFYQNVDVYEHIHHSDIPTKVKMEYWFQSDEYDRRQSECATTITKMEKLGSRSFNKVLQLQQDDDYCIRGLESRTKAGRRIIDKSRTEAYNVVRYEQNCQWSDITRHSLDVDALACVYKSVAQSSAAFARNQGIKDEEYVKSECYGLSSNKSSSSPVVGNYKKASSFFGPSTTTTRRNSSLRMFQSSDSSSSTHRRSVY